MTAYHVVFVASRMHHPIVHIMLALQLALWTPVMCCCAIKGAIGNVTGIHATSCDGDGCCAIASAPVQSCCDSIESKSTEEESDTGCTCHERVTDRISIDTGSKVIVPAPLVIGMLAFAQVAFDASDIERVAFVGNLIERCHPPPNTLVARHILLLI